VNNQNPALQSRGSLQDYPTLKSGKDLIVCQFDIELNHAVTWGELFREAFSRP